MGLTDPTRQYYWVSQCIKTWSWQTSLDAFWLSPHCTLPFLFLLLLRISFLFFQFSFLNTECDCLGLPFTPRPRPISWAQPELRQRLLCQRAVKSTGSLFLQMRVLEGQIAWFSMVNVKFQSTSLGFLWSTSGCRWCRHFSSFRVGIN